MQRQGTESDDESVEVCQPESATDWFTPGERRQANVRVLDWLRTEKDRPKTQQELLHAMKRFCFLMSVVPWTELINILYELKCITPVDDNTKQVNWNLEVLRDAEIPNANILGAVFLETKKMLLEMDQRKEPLPTHGPEIRRLLSPLCNVRHELEPEEILHELVMTEVIEIKDNNVTYNDAKLTHRETNWYAIAAMVILLISVSAALLEAASRTQY